MKTFVMAILALVLVMTGIGASNAARAQHYGGHAGFTQHHGGHARFGFYFGVPLYGPAYYPYYAPPYYYPRYYPPIVVNPSPTVYIEQGSTQPAPAQGASEAWWYYCAESRAYYPYVKECPGSWQRVAPRPPNG